ncbi:XRE family transcriptional regulator [Halopseudomonas laoshanensis]|uniref:XRE family transcriptional regulator n=1 Tax=Halopseudomonas laoshanensis TaxID=2268758 RepID=A0A7V7GXD3_9GAMM|nr:helix-turn-helix transcriptional regulator [Halopseudomonas laoshanensis]KAA0696998.1 XRE family transcriptional regulator [Halopseudomonas laoshanensis]
MSKSLYRPETTILLMLIKECRTEAGLTQADFAKALDRPQSFVSDIERGSRRLDVIQLRDVCQVFGLTLIEFVMRLENKIAESQKQ